MCGCVKDKVCYLNGMLTISSSAVGFPAAVTGLAAHKRVMAVVGPIETANARYRTDGTNPDANTGRLLATTDTFERVLSGKDILDFKAIRTTVTDGVLSYSIYGE